MIADLRNFNIGSSKPAWESGPINDPNCGSEQSETTLVSGGELAATLGPGDVFGEMALRQDLRRNADVVAVARLRLAALMSWDFRETANRFPDFQRRVEEVVISRSIGSE